MLEIERCSRQIIKHTPTTPDKLITFIFLFQKQQQKNIISFIVVRNYGTTSLTPSQISQTKTCSKNISNFITSQHMTPTMRTIQLPHRFVLFSLYLSHHRLFSFFLLLWSSLHSAIIMCLLRDILLSFGSVSPMASCSVLFCPVLSCPVMSCPVLICHVVSPVSSFLFTSCHVFKVFFSHLMY